MKPTVRTETVTVKGPIPFYVTGAAAVLFALIFPLYKWSHLIIFAIFLAAVFFVTEKLAPKETKTVEIKEPPKTTGNAEADRLIYEGSLVMEEIEKLNAKIADPVLTAKIDKISGLTDKILDEVARDPDDAPAIRRFSDYFLPTIRKLLENYVVMKDSGAGESVQNTLLKIETSVDQMTGSFEKLLDSLYDKEVLDVTSDIAVTETMLVQQGLSDGKSVLKTGSYAEEAENVGEDIKLTLGGH